MLGVGGYLTKYYLLVSLYITSSYAAGGGRQASGIRAARRDTFSNIRVMPRCTHNFMLSCQDKCILLSVRSPRGRRDAAFRCTLIEEKAGPSNVPKSCAIVRAPVEDIIYVASLRLSGFVGVNRLSGIMKIADAQRLFGERVGRHLGDKGATGVNVRKGFSGRIVVDVGPSLVLISPFGQNKCRALGSINVPLVPRLNCGRVAPLKRTR